MKEETKLRFKVGDKVRIVADNASHGLPIGSIARIDKLCISDNPNATGCKPSTFVSDWEKVIEEYERICKG